MPQIPIFIINLKQSTDRWERISAELDQLGLTYEKFPAVYGADLSDDEIKKYCPNRHLWWTRRDLKLGEIGCYLSHIYLLEEIVKRGIDRACVLEDDAWILPEFLQWVRSDTPLPDNADILKLTINGEYHLSRGIKVGSYANRLITFLTFRGVHGTYGYIITREGAIKALERLSTIRDGIDHAMFEFWNSGLVSYCVYPPVVRTGEESIIGAEGRAVKKTGQLKKAIGLRLRKRVRDVKVFYKKHTFLFKLFGPWYPFKIRSFADYSDQ